MTWTVPSGSPRPDPRDWVSHMSRVHETLGSGLESRSLSLDRRPSPRRKKEKQDSTPEPLWMERKLRKDQQHRMGDQREPPYPLDDRLLRYLTPRRLLQCLDSSIVPFPSHPSARLWNVQWSSAVRGLEKIEDEVGRRSERRPRRPTYVVCSNMFGLRLLGLYHRRNRDESKKVNLSLHSGRPTVTPVRVPVCLIVSDLTLFFRRRTGDEKGPDLPSGVGVSVSR